MTKNTLNDLSQLLNNFQKPLRWRHDAGSAIDRLLTDDRADAYGRKEMERILAGLRETVPQPRLMDRRTMYQMQSFAKSFTLQDVERMSGVTWAAARAVLSIPKASDRRQLLDQAVAEGWASRRIESEVRAYRQKHGRKSDRSWADLADTIRVMKNAAKSAGRDLKERLESLGRLEASLKLVDKPRLASASASLRNDVEDLATVLQEVLQEISGEKQKLRRRSA